MRLACLLCPLDERELLELIDAGRPDRTPRFRELSRSERPDRPAHAYAQTTRRDARLQDNAARSDSHSGRAA
jgi:hypothetical protein